MDQVRDDVLRRAWVRPIDGVPQAPDQSEHFAIEVWGVVQDIFFNDGKPFADVVSYWPALRMWTVTGTVRGGEDVADQMVRVIAWQYLPPLPLWALNMLKGAHDGLG